MAGELKVNVDIDIVQPSNLRTGYIKLYTVPLLLEATASGWSTWDKYRLSLGFRHRREREGGGEGEERGRRGGGEEEERGRRGRGGGGVEKGGRGKGAVKRKGRKRRKMERRGRRERRGWRGGGRERAEYM